MARLNEVLDYKSKYTYDNGVLKNKLNIHEQEKLDQAERLITTVRLTELFDNTDEIISENNFDANHYYFIHKYLFKDIYKFAGEVRNENIYKTFSFCPVEFIHSYLTETLKKALIEAKNIQSEEDIISFLAKYYSELDMTHPFREGNGRTLREFLREYVIKINKMIDFGEYELHYERFNDRERFITAVRIAATSQKSDSLEPLKDIFRACLVNTKEKNHVR